MTQDTDPTKIIRHALAEGSRRGLDTMGRMHHAIGQVRSLRPDLNRDTVERMVYDIIWSDDTSGSRTGNKGAA